MNTQLSEVYEFNPITVTLPNQQALCRLAVNDSGFVFDPVNGDSFTVNACGLEVLRLLKDGHSLSDVLDHVSKEYKVNASQAERDILDFILQLRKYYK